MTSPLKGVSFGVASYKTDTQSTSLAPVVALYVLVNLCLVYLLVKRHLFVAKLEYENAQRYNSLCEKAVNFIHDQRLVDHAVFTHCAAVIHQSWGKIKEIEKRNFPK